MAEESWSDTQLRLAVAKELRVVDQRASSLRADWDAELATHSRQVRATLIQKGVCYWPADEIPEEAQIGLKWLVAEAAKSFWGRDSYNKGAAGMELLEEMSASAPKNEPTRTEFF